MFESSLAYAPPGWPDEVRPPGAPDWEVTATAYLLDCCPADFRSYRVLRNHPIVLAQFARHFVEGQSQAAQEGLAAVRTGLQDFVEPSVLEEATQAWLEQSARLVRTRRAVAMVEAVLRGRTFVPKM
jgi:hypothetical protein